MRQHSALITLEFLHRRMVDAAAWFYTVRDAGDSPPVVVKTLGDAAVAAIDAYQDMFERYARIYEEVRREFALDPRSLT